MASRSSARRTWAALVVMFLLLATCAPARSPAANPAASTAAVPVVRAPATTASAAAPTEPPLSTTVRVGMHGRPDQAALQLAIDRGYFVRQGLDIEAVPFSTGPEMVPALSTDQIQVGSGTPSAALFNAFNRGIDIRMVADWTHIGPDTDRSLSLVVRSDLADAGAVQSAVDLRGRTVALGAATGTVADLFFQRLLEREGAADIEIDRQNISLPDIVSALANRRLDAGILIEPVVTQAVGQGSARVLYPAGAVIPGTQVSVLQYSPRFATEQTEGATRFMVGYLEGVRDYYDAFHLKRDRDAAIELLVQSLSLKSPQLWEAVTPFYVDLNGQINVDNLYEQAAFYAQQGSLSGPIPDFGRLVDARFAAAAVQQLGRR